MSRQYNYNSYEYNDSYPRCSRWDDLHLFPQSQPSDGRQNERGMNLAYHPSAQRPRQEPPWTFEQGWRRRESYREYRGRGRGRGRRGTRQPPRLQGRYPRRDKSDRQQQHEDNNSQQDRPRPGRKASTELKPSHYYEVELIHGCKYDKELLWTLISSHIKPATMIPLEAENTRRDIKFTVSDQSVAQLLSNASGKITLGDGSKLEIIVKPVKPAVKLNVELCDILKSIVNGRYNFETLALNLSDLQNDEGLISKGRICDLTDSKVATFLINHIALSNIGIRAIYLNQNYLDVADQFETACSKLSSIEILHLANNKFTGLEQLSPLKGLNLTQINLDGNPIRNAFDQFEDYARGMRDLFPKLTLLDGLPLALPIGFDLDDAMGTLPPPQTSFLCNMEAGAKAMNEFLQLYYKMFDSTDRSGLHEAYHERASFSLSCSIFHKENARFSAYAENDRNVFRALDTDKKMKLLKTGKNSIVHFLKTFVNTEHVVSSFVTDLLAYTPTRMLLVVGGLYREVSDDPNGGSNAMKYFSRTFLVVDLGSGQFIMNDEMVILHPTDDQLEAYKNNRDPKLHVTPLPTTTCFPPKLQILEDYDDIHMLEELDAADSAKHENLKADAADLAKREQLMFLSEKTGMNSEWTLKCLEETKWDLKIALQSFETCQRSGTVPPEAFQKD